MKYEKIIERIKKTFKILGHAVPVRYMDVGYRRFNLNDIVALLLANSYEWAESDEIDEWKWKTIRKVLSLVNKQIKHGRLDWTAIPVITKEYDYYISWHNMKDYLTSLLLSLEGDVKPVIEYLIDTLDKDLDEEIFKEVI